MKKTIVFTILFILLFSSFTFASSNHTIELIYKTTNTRYKIISSSRVYVEEYMDSTKPSYRFKTKDNTLYNVYYFSDGIWKLAYENFNSFSRGKNDIEVYLSNFDILFLNDSNNVFFSLPIWNQGLEGAKTTLLGTILKPLPIILGLVICGLQLQKGWKMLKTVLLGG